LVITQQAAGMIDEQLPELNRGTPTFCTKSSSYSAFAINGIATKVPRELPRFVNTTTSKILVT